MENTYVKHLKTKRIMKTVVYVQTVENNQVYISEMAILDSKKIKNFDVAKVIAETIFASRNKDSYILMEAHEDIEAIRAHSQEYHGTYLRGITDFALWCTRVVVKRQEPSFTEVSTKEFIGNVFNKLPLNIKLIVSESGELWRVTAMINTPNPDHLYMVDRRAVTSAIKEEFNKLEIVTVPEVYVNSQGDYYFLTPTKLVIESRESDPNKWSIYKVEYRQVVDHVNEVEL